MHDTGQASLASRPATLPGRAPRSSGPASAAAPAHGHLWTLRDGTPSHVPPGRLTVSDDGRLACHLCGRWFTHLGGHLRRHGWTAAQYRDAVGLPLHVPLCSADLSAQITTRQKRAWDTRPEMRARLEPGRQLARSGDLSRLAADASKARDRSGRTPGVVRAARSQRLAAGRATMARRRQERLDGIVAAAGAADLSAMLRVRYASGLSLAELARLTGLGRTRLRAELIAAGVQIRLNGVNKLSSKRARAARNDAVAAAQVGTADIRAWLLSRYQEGATLRDLASQVNRSIPWIRSRLAGASTAAGPSHDSRSPDS